jgi:hypothetical protein
MKAFVIPVVKVQQAYAALVGQLGIEFLSQVFIIERKRELLVITLQYALRPIGVQPLQVLVK